MSVFEVGEFGKEAAHSATHDIRKPKGRTEKVAIVAQHGQVSGKLDGEEVSVSKELFKNTLGQWAGKPVVINHQDDMVVGSVTREEMKDGDQLVHGFDVDEEILQFIEEDAHSGFSIGLVPDSIVLNDDNEIIDGEPAHLSVTFFPELPACSKDECHVVFSDSDSPEIDALNEDRLVRIRLSKEEHTFESAWNEGQDRGFGPKQTVIEEEDHYVVERPNVPEDLEIREAIAENSARAEISKDELSIDSNEDTGTVLFPASPSKDAEPCGGQSSSEGNTMSCDCGEKGDNPAEFNEAEPEGDSPDGGGEPEPQQEETVEDTGLAEEEAVPLDEYRELEGRVDDLEGELEQKDEIIKGFVQDKKEKAAQELPEVSDEYREAISDLGEDDDWTDLSLQRLDEIKTMKDKGLLVDPSEETPEEGEEPDSGDAPEEESEPETVNEPEPEAEPEEESEEIQEPPVQETKEPEPGTSEDPEVEQAREYYADKIYN